MALSIPQHRREQLFIGGTWRDPQSDRRINVVNPASGEGIASIPEAGSEDAALAVTLAKDSFETGPWAQMTLAERGKILRRAIELIDKHRDELIETVVTDLGAPRAYAAFVHDIGVEIWTEYADLADTLSVESVGQGADGRRVLVRKEPVGVVLAVVPWNGPFILTSLKLVPALLAGCSVIVKPAPETPFASLILADILKEVGVPDGVISFLPGGRDLGEHLLNDPRVDMVSFTGGTESGKSVMAAAAKNLTRVTLELGGKSAAIVLDDIDPVDALPALAAGMLSQSGQVCTTLSRIITSHARHDEWRDALAEMFESQVIGDPDNVETTFGPLASRLQKERVLTHIERAKQEGGIIVTGGTVPEGLEDGYFVEPTLVDGVTPSMSLAQQEVFGPVYALMTYEDVDDAIRIANDSDFGLSGAVMTNDINAGVEIGKRIRTGTFSVNGFGGHMSFPFGGYKQSGMGREGGVAGLEEFFETKQIAVPAGSHVF